MRPFRLLISVLCLFATLGLVPSVPSSGAASSPSASIMLQTTVGPPTTSTSLRGSGFGHAETIDVTFDGAPLRHAVTGPGGRFLTRVTIPASALPGPHSVEAAGETSGRFAKAAFTVRTDWTMFRGGLAHTGYNPYENVLNPSNVSSLVEAWSFDTGSIVFSSPAVVGGVVYVGSYNLALYALDAATGAKLWRFRPASAVRSSPTVANGTVYFGGLYT